MTRCRHENLLHSHAVFLEDGILSFALPRFHTLEELVELYRSKANNEVSSCCPEVFACLANAHDHHRADHQAAVPRTRLLGVRRHRLQVGFLVLDFIFMFSDVHP